MFQTTHYSGDRDKDYPLLIKQLEALNEGETNRVAILANASALLDQYLSNVNWVGFYLWDSDELVLGPFQGLPACIRIPYGKGVCGTALSDKKTQLVKDVRAFPGHIACDSASKSEIVIPLYMNDIIFGVLDIDSPTTNRFDSVDQHYLEKFAETLMDYITNHTLEFVN
ncbi:MAG TPA: GAF domain-containing protein [Bacillota bacterium]|nr:GAF domain-containing protein [Bacillota bacterium]